MFAHFGCGDAHLVGSRWAPRYFEAINAIDVDGGAVLSIRGSAPGTIRAPDLLVLFAMPAAPAGDSERTRLR